MVLEVSSLVKSFGSAAQPVSVLRGLDFALAEGAFEVVMGASGSGKSTFLHLVAGLLAPDAGSICVDGTLTSALKDAELARFRRRKLGIVFQDFNLLPTLTAFENAELPLRLNRAADAAALARVRSLFEMLGIASCAARLPGQLSGGERQRVAIARALATDPALVLADEPTGNLDRPAAEEFCRRLAALHAERKVTILMVTHDPLVAAAADRVHVLKDGVFAGAFDTQHDPERVSREYLALLRG